ncbi:hypothetical protein CSC70_04455 [Pseudoxanthomonas kalamensis DSM 18571]|nr:hypothetical protein CSC70_04455 [Pseudoxanthomonas kalamensis DSM 18571]
MSLAGLACLLGIGVAMAVPDSESKPMLPVHAAVQGETPDPVVLAPAEQDDLANDSTRLLPEGEDILADAPSQLRAVVNPSFLPRFGLAPAHADTRRRYRGQAPPRG